MKTTIPVSTRIGMLAILAIACFVFLPSINYHFTNWDDDIYVTNNPAIHQLSLESLAGLFRPTAKYMYHPLTMVSYSLDWKSGEGSPLAFHATNILLHLLNILLVFVFLRKILASEGAVLFATAVFALHPLQVESVAWISARKELLYTFFYLAALSMYFQQEKKNRFLYYVISLFFFACSLFSKPTAVTLPMVIVLAEFWRTKKLGIKEVYRILPFFIGALTFAFFFIRNQTEQAPPPMKYYSFTQQFLLIAYQLVFYLWKALLPFKLSSCYAYPQLMNNMLPWVYYATPVFFAAIAAALWLLKKKSATLSAGLIFYVVTLSPVLQLVPFNNASLVADRYMYLPILGIAFFFCQCAEFIESQLSSYVPKIHIPKGLPAGLFVLCLFVISVGRISVWQDSITLFNDVIEKNDRINIAYGDRANAKILAGDFSGALEDCNRLIEISPSNGKAYYNMGTAHSGLKLYRDAADDFSRSIDLGYTVASVYYNRGTACYHLGSIDSALSDYRATELRDPQFADAQYSIGYVMLHDRKDPAAALRCFESVLSVHPDHVEALYQKASAEYDLRSYGMAMSDLAAAISRQPALQNDSLVARINTSIDSVNTAISKINDRLASAPGSINEYVQRSRLFLMLGDSTRSILDLKTAALPLQKKVLR
jgi:protein O-mannosyl-transferase